MRFMESQTKIRASGVSRPQAARLLASSPRIFVSQISPLLSVLKLFLDVFLISLDLPLHLLGDGRKLLIRFIAWFERLRATMISPPVPVQTLNKIRGTLI